MQAFRLTAEIMRVFAGSFGSLPVRSLGRQWFGSRTLGRHHTDAAATYRQKRNLSPYGFESVPNAWSLDRDVAIQQHAARTKRITGSKRPVMNGGMLLS